MRTNIRPLRYKKERVILSDVLPYEIPATFSTRHLYEYLIENHIEIEHGHLKWKGADPVVQQINRLLLGLPNQNLRSPFNIFRTSEKIPFNFKTRHKENDFRELTVIHPLSQIQVVDFYNRFKELVLYYCSLSPFSIRKPVKVSRFIYHKDKTHYRMLDLQDVEGSPEQYDREYEHLKTFFVYKDYNNIHKFYESYKFHRCEMRYDKMFRFDISKCFDSIYTHTISWALLNRTIVKDRTDESKKTFGGQFDGLMCGLNYNETNGIVIGPEFSRIFAEIILQKIDSKVADLLKEKGFHQKRDYELFRYVDDYFIFYNDELVKNEALQLFRLELKEFNLYINEAKSISYPKPIITSITIAKQRLVDLFDSHLTLGWRSIKPSAGEEGVGAISLKIEESLYASSNKVITKFKTIISETKVDYKDILNYSLALIERKSVALINSFLRFSEIENIEKGFITSLLTILDIVFFLYSMSPRVNTTIRLCRILNAQINIVKSKRIFNSDLRHLLLKKIFDGVRQILKKNAAVNYTQVETLYLLISLSELGKDYWLDAESLRKFLGIKSDSGRMYIDGQLNYFSITVSLLYMRNKTRYDEIRRFVQGHILERFKEVSPGKRGKSTELVLLLFDSICCPYLETSFKRELFKLHDLLDVRVQDAIISKKKYWFTKWVNFDFGAALDAKHSYEVY